MPLTVEAVSATGPIGSTLADRYRADAHKAGYGNGYCGFAITCSTADELDSIHVFCQHPRAELFRAKAIWAPLPPAAFRCASYSLQIDARLSGSPVTGWAIDRSRPTVRRPLQLMSDGQLLAWQHATLFRQELVGSGGDGLYGFSFTCPLKDVVELRDAANGLTVRVPTLR